MRGLFAAVLILASGSTVCHCRRRTPQELVEAFGYPFEQYWVTTPDGYILGLHRVPRGKTGKSNNKVVFVQHGILMSSADWLLFGPGRSLGYILADEGYDVWLGNVRGNTYSRNHTHLNPDRDHLYWDFSWHEIGYYDVPAMIDFALNKTGASSVYYVGHSQGTTVFYVMASTRPEYNSKIKIQVSMAPVAFMNHLISPLPRLMALVDIELAATLMLVGRYEFIPSEGFMGQLSLTSCSFNALAHELCKNALFAVTGFDTKNLNASTIPIIFEFTPAGSSTKQFLHYGQEINSGYFRNFDYGLVRNILIYGTLFPPDYALSKITAPVHLFYGANDWMAAVQDVRRLYNALPNAVATEMPDQKCNHLDFIYGTNAPTAMYPKITDLFARN